MNTWNTMITYRTWYIFITMRYELHKQLRYDHTQGPCHTRQSNNTKVSCTHLPKSAFPCTTYAFIYRRCQGAVTTLNGCVHNRTHPFTTRVSIPHGHIPLHDKTQHTPTRYNEPIIYPFFSQCRWIWWISSETCVPARSHTILPLVPMHVVMC